jgi:Protein of unknown function (DUF3551)
MILRITAAILALTVMAAPGAGKTSPYWPWCSQYYDRSLAHACAFASREQCMETVSGIGGICYRNPSPRPDAAPAGRPAKPHRRAAKLG